MRIFPIVKKIIQAASGDADITWDDRVLKMDDAVKPTVQIADKVLKLDDVTSLHNPAIGDKVLKLDDARIVPDLAAVYPEANLKMDDTAKGQLSSLYVPRTGTPDADMTGDGWTDGVPIRNGDTHGGDAVLTVSGALVLATTTYAWLKWDLRRFVNLTIPTGGTMVIDLWMANGLAVAQNTRFNISSKAAVNPFTESTLAWSNQPTLGTSQATRTISTLVDITPGVAQPYQITLTKAEADPFLGNWMVMRCDSDALIATPITVVSREGATAGQRPRLSFGFQRT